MEYQKYKKYKSLYKKLKAGSETDLNLKILSLNCLGTGNCSHNSNFFGLKWPNIQYNYKEDFYLHKINGDEIKLLMNSQYRYDTIKNQLEEACVADPDINVICLQEVDLKLKNILKKYFDRNNGWKWILGEGQGKPSADSPQWAMPYTIVKKSACPVRCCDKIYDIKSTHFQDNAYSNRSKKYITNLPTNIYIGDLNVWNPRSRSKTPYQPNRSLIENIGRYTDGSRGEGWRLVALKNSALFTQGLINSTYLDEKVNDSLDGIMIPDKKKLLALCGKSGSKNMESQTSSSLQSNFYKPLARSSEIQEINYELDNEECQEPEILDITYDIPGMDPNSWFNPDEPKPLFNVIDYSEKQTELSNAEEQDTEQVKTIIENSGNDILSLRWNILSDHRPFLVSLSV